MTEVEKHDFNTIYQNRLVYWFPNYECWQVCSLQR